MGWAADGHVCVNLMAHLVRLNEVSVPASPSSHMSFLVCQRILLMTPDDRRVP
jgi:hypothetical protein